MVDNRTSVNLKFYDFDFKGKTIKMLSKNNQKHEKCAWIRNYKITVWRLCFFQLIVE